MEWKKASFGALEARTNPARGAVVLAWESGRDKDEVEPVGHDDAFQQLVANRDHVAIVLDEYGGMSGLVTMEDVVETLLGLEIVDEADTREDMQEFARNLWKNRASKMGLEVEEPSEPNGEGKEVAKEAKADTSV